jgi:neuropeptide Y receptor
MASETSLTGIIAELAFNASMQNHLQDSLDYSVMHINTSHSGLAGDTSANEHSRLKIAILGTLYTLIFIIGITGNSLVVYVVCAKKSMQSVTNLFIMNLGLSDILMCLLAVPFTPIAFFLESWVLGKFLCHLVSYSTGISVYVSTLTSLAIAIDRYFVIVHPFKPRMKLGICILLIAVVWIVSLSISLPLAIYMKLFEEVENGEIKYQCKESWPIPMSKRFFNLASYVLQYLIPFTVITYSYVKVWIVLSKRTRPGTRREQEREHIELKRKKKTNRMLVAMVVIFAGCWMPLNCVHLLMEFHEPFNTKSYSSTVFFVAHVIAMSSTIYNPFLYAWLNDNFRKEFYLILPWIFTLIKWFGKSPNRTNDLKSEAVEIEMEACDQYENSRFLTKNESFRKISNGSGKANENNNNNTNLHDIKVKESNLNDLNSIESNNRLDEPNEQEISKK